MNAHIAGRNVVVVAPGVDSDALRKAARKVACGEAHTATIGKLVSVRDGAGKVTYTWGPVTLRTGAAKPPVTPEVATPEVATPDLAGMSKRELRALVETLLAGQAAPKPAREVPEFIARSRAATCRTCRDLGVVRGVGQDAGKPYRTQKGADAAKAAGRAVKCPSHKRAAKAA
jgi:hypothetical protein